MARKYGKVQSSREALAGELKVPFLKVDLAELESKFIGRNSQKLACCIQAVKPRRCIVVF